MNVKKLKRSIAVIFVLIGLVILQHMVLLADMRNSLTALLINIAALIFTCIYFVQLSRNLRDFLFISRIKYKAYMIAASYCITYLSIAWITFDIKNPYYPTAVDKGIRVLLVLIALATFINQLVQYCILGYRLVKNAGFPFVKELGLTFLYAIPFMFVCTVIFLLFKPLKGFSHVFIIIELLPYWFTYQIYQALIAKQLPETQDLIVTNAAVIPGEEQNIAG